MNRWVVGLAFGGMAVMGSVLVLLSAADKAGWLEAKAAASAAPAAPAPLPHDPQNPPRMEAPEGEYNFGVMDIDENGTHDFVVANHGQGDLTLELKGTSCKCTLANLPDGRVPPGEERNVRLEWTTEENVAEFRHGAVLRTNDPDQPELRLVVVGRVRRRLVREPSDLVIIGRALPTQRASHGVWFYSQLYPKLEVVSVEPSHPELLSWEVEPVGDDDIKRWSATSALKLKITLEPGQPEGRINSTLKVRFRVPGLPDDQQPPDQVVDVHTQVLKRVRLFGTRFEPGKILNLEQLVEGEGITSTVFLALRSEETEVNVLETHCTPDFLQVRFERDESSVDGWARYKIIVTVPEDAPNVNLLGTDLGEIRLVTDHPDVQEVRFRVALAIAPAPKPVYGEGP